jgi:[1-hydroxy-2-(trimethylamino)ethyl]phosphonate dioxygenase
METKNDIVASILNLFNDKGHSEYGGEAVTQLEHALQTATLARENNASDQLVTAALLHDIGHLLHDLPNDAPLKGIDDVHENKAAVFLRKYFPEAVTEPVRLHVMAKRYLSSTEETYYSLLSEPSKQSLVLQGGLMSSAEVSAFEQNPFFSDAVMLRKWDDQAKVQELTTAPVEDFEKNIAVSLRLYFLEESL